MFKSRKETEFTEITQLTEYSPLPWKKWFWVALDRIIGKVEMCHVFLKKTPSVRARKEYLDYYKGLYHSSSPDLKKIQRLLIRNGVPEWPNPFPEGLPEHYHIHPDGFLSGDLLAVLEDWKESKLGEEISEEEKRMKNQYNLSNDANKSFSVHLHTSS